MKAWSATCCAVGPQQGLSASLSASLSLSLSLSLLSPLLQDAGNAVRFSLSSFFRRKEGRINFKAILSPSTQLRKMYFLKIIINRERLPGRYRTGWAAAWRVLVLTWIEERPDSLALHWPLTGLSLPHCPPSHHLLPLPHTHLTSHHRQCIAFEGRWSVMEVRGSVADISTSCFCGEREPV